MGFHAMEDFSRLHVCANGHIQLSMNLGSSLNGKHQLTPLTRPSTWVLLIFLNQFPQGVAILMQCHRGHRSFAPFRMTSSFILDLTMKYMPSLPRSNMNLSNVGLRSPGDAELPNPHLCPEQMTLSRPMFLTVHLVPLLPGRDVALHRPGPCRRINGNRASGTF